jgi:hypothetical protein
MGASRWETNFVGRDLLFGAGRPFRSSLEVLETRDFYSAILLSVYHLHVGKVVKLYGQAAAEAVGRSEAPPVSARCVVEYFHGDSARCLVEIEGHAVPVDLPEGALRPHGLRENMKFEWVMDGDVVRPQDIRPLPAPVLSMQEREEIDRLYEEDRQDPAPDVWERLSKG